MNVEMRGIIKAFGKTRVLNGVDFSLTGGNICAMLGANGAGKSTLMNILGGVLPQDGGEILLDGKPVSFRSPIDAFANKIAFIHQELNLVNDLTVYENIFLGRELKKGIFTDKAEMIAECERVFAEMGVELDPCAVVRNLDSSYKQMVEIARSLHMNASVLIMDEPTTSLTDSEIKRVFKLMRHLADNGVGIIFISHKLNEIMEVCTHFYVLRDGVVVSNGKTEDTSVEKLAYDMIGRKVTSEKRADKNNDSCKELLRCENLSCKPYFNNISFTLKEGETVGFTGLMGDGRSELFSALFGALYPYEGTVFIEGKPTCIKSTEIALKNGIGYVPKNRNENGIIKDMSILDNGTVVTWCRDSFWGLLKKKTIKKQFEQKRNELQIKMNTPENVITSLSGGNQQKVILAKWLEAAPKVLILDNPTQGVDVGAKEEIYGIIESLAQTGMAIVILSGENREIIRLCDRAFVMFHGEIQGELQGEELNDRSIMRLSMGGKTQ